MRNSPSPRWPLATALLLSISATAMAQQANSGTPIGAATSAGQSGRPSSTGPKSGRTWSIKPRIGLTMTATDNVQVGGTAGKESDLITELAPGIRVEAHTARLQGHFDYALRGQQYLRSSHSRTQNALNALGTLEAVDNWLYVEASGNISQQAISAFGTQSPSDSSLNNNSTETATYRLSPYIRGQIGGFADYLVRYNVSTTRADSAGASDVDIGQWVARLSGSTPFRNLQWTIDGNRQTTDYSNGRKTDADLLRVLATYSITSQFRISASGGWESNNYTSLDQQSHSTYGYGFDWNPTTRTQVSAFRENRFFGNGHRFSFNHRFPMSSIRFSDNRDVSVLPNQFSTTGPDSNAVQLQALATQICTLLLGANATQPQIDACISQALGPNVNQQVTSSFLTSQANVQRQQQLAFALFGARNSITLQLNRTENSSLLVSNAIADDFAQSSVIRQRGVSVNVSHRLSQLSSLNATASRQQSTGTGTGSANLKTTTTLYLVSVSTKLGAKTTGSLSLRHSDFDNATNPYTENALVGAINYTY